MTKEGADLLLLHWGAWHRGGSHLGLTSTNIIGRCMDEGAGASQSTAQGLPHMDSKVELVESCVLQMSKELQRLAKHKYIGLESDKYAAKKLRVTLDVYQTRANQVLLFVSEYIRIT